LTRDNSSGFGGGTTAGSTRARSRPRGNGGGWVRAPAVPLQLQQRSDYRCESVVRRMFREGARPYSRIDSENAMQIMS
jgi:hypothetical protein